MAHIPVVYFEISATLLLAGMITIAMEDFSLFLLPLHKLVKI